MTLTRSKRDTAASAQTSYLTSFLNRKRSLLLWFYFMMLIIVFWYWVVDLTETFLSTKALYGSVHDCFQKYLGSDFIFGKILVSNDFFGFRFHRFWPKNKLKILIKNILYPWFVITTLKWEFSSFKLNFFHLDKNLNINSVTN